MGRKSNAQKALEESAKAAAAREAEILEEAQRWREEPDAASGAGEDADAPPMGNHEPSDEGQQAAGDDAAPAETSDGASAAGGETATAVAPVVAPKKRGRPTNASKQLGLGAGINSDRHKDLDEAGEEYVGAIKEWKEASEHVVEKKKQVDALMKKHGLEGKEYKLLDLDPPRVIFYKPAKDASVAIRKAKDEAEIYRVGGLNDEDAEDADDAAREAAGEGDLH